MNSGDYPGAIFLISHERAFVNAVCKAIVSLQDDADLQSKRLRLADVSKDYRVNVRLKEIDEVDEIVVEKKS